MSSIWPPAGAVSGCFEVVAAFNLQVATATAGSRVGTHTSGNQSKSINSGIACNQSDGLAAVS
jgi:hypothetical protein